MVGHWCTVWPKVCGHHTYMGTLDIPFRNHGLSFGVDPAFCSCGRLIKLSSFALLLSYWNRAGFVALLPHVTVTLLLTGTNKRYIVIPPSSPLLLACFVSLHNPELYLVAPGNFHFVLIA